jgi:cytochrome c553
MHRITLAAALAGLLATSGCADLGRSRSLSNPDVAAVTIAQQVCSTCHGMTGVAESPNFPNLAGQTAEYLVGQLRGFRGHSRSDPAGFEYMWGLSRSLTDAQIDGLAAYYEAQAPARQAPESEAARIAAGRQIATAGLPDKAVPPCTSCHGSEAQGQGKFPRLAGQHADYLVKQLEVFQRTDERPEGAVMTVVAHGLTPQDIADVSAYLQAAPPP